MLSDSVRVEVEGFVIGVFPPVLAAGRRSSPAYLLTKGKASSPTRTAGPPATRFPFCVQVVRGRGPSPARTASLAPVCGRDREDFRPVRNPIANRPYLLKTLSGRSTLRRRLV